MNDWAKLITTTSATPVWDLNVLTSSLDEQIAMLDAAEQLGMSVHYVELGNELWDPRSIYPTIYPSGTAYATAMNTWIPALRRRFGNIQIAVSGADPSDPFFSDVFGARYLTWNTEVLPVTPCPCSSPQCHPGRPCARSMYHVQRRSGRTRQSSGSPSPVRSPASFSSIWGPSPSKCASPRS